MTKAPMLLVFGLVAGAQAGTAAAQEKLSFSPSYEFTAAYFDSDNTYWGLVRALIPGSKIDYAWAEAYAKVGLDFSLPTDAGLGLYGGVSAIGSMTAGEDVVGTRDVESVVFETYYIGVKLDAGTVDVDLSVGAQPYVVGTGMLLNDGSPEGSARGAVTLAPFKAWDKSVILRLTSGQWSADAFYLDPDEIYEPDTFTTLAGVKVERSLGEDQFAGIVAGHVIESEASYPQSINDGTAVAIIPNGRDGLNFVNAYGKGNPFAATMPGFYLSGDFAYQWNDRIDMQAWGARIGFGRTFQDVQFQPTLSYNFHTMSGDKPGTARLERFDPLFGGGESWAIGGNSALILANSNISVHRLALAARITPRDIIGAKYFHIRTNEIESPISLDPSVPTIPELLGGTKHLADDISVDYTRILGDGMFFNAAFLYSKPAALLDGFAGESLPDWTSLTATLTLRF